MYELNSTAVDKIKDTLKRIEKDGVCKDDVISIESLFGTTVITTNSHINSYSLQPSRLGYDHVHDTVTKALKEVKITDIITYDTVINLYQNLRISAMNVLEIINDFKYLDQNKLNYLKDENSVYYDDDVVKRYADKQAYNSLVNDYDFIMSVIQKTSSNENTMSAGMAFDKYISYIKDKEHMVKKDDSSEHNEFLPLISSLTKLESELVNIYRGLPTNIVPVTLQTLLDMYNKYDTIKELLLRLIKNIEEDLKQFSSVNRKGCYPFIDDVCNDRYTTTEVIKTVNTLNNTLNVMKDESSLYVLGAFIKLFRV